MIKRLDLLSLPLYPMYYFDNIYYDGIFENNLNTCNKCTNIICKNVKNLKDFDIQECQEKLLFFKITLLGKPYVIYGLENSFTSLSKNEKKKYSNRIFFKHYKEMKKWKESIHKIFEDKAKEAEKIDSIFIHDIKKTVSTIYRRVENYIRDNCNSKNMEKCIQESDSNILGIYKAVNLVDYQFNIIDYVANPESITYGGTKGIKVYKIVDKLIRILQTTSEIKVSLEGTSHSKLYLYDSFITLIFVILDNAIKYSLKGQTVQVLVNDFGSDIEISISSYSPFLNNESKKNIFKKYYRENSELEGQGIGLYLAEIISKELQSNIEIICDNNTANYNGIEYCTVTFKFLITNID